MKGAWVGEGRRGDGLDSKRILQCMFLVMADESNNTAFYAGKYFHKHFT